MILYKSYMQMCGQCHLYLMMVGVWERIHVLYESGYVEKD